MQGAGCLKCRGDRARGGAAAGATDEVWKPFLFRGILRWEGSLGVVIHMASYFYYKIQYKYSFQYKIRPNPRWYMWFLTPWSASVTAKMVVKLTKAY